MTCKETGHSLVVDTSFVNLGSCRRCGMIKTHAGEWKLKFEALTLDNIYKYASDEELEAIVFSIVGRLWGQCYPHDKMPTDKELHEVAKGLRKPQ
jgi:hypothetical protein